MMYVCEIKETREILECPKMPVITKLLRKSFGFPVMHGQKIRTALIEEGKYETRNFVLYTSRQ